MAEIERGLKSGILAGVVSGFLYSVVSVVLMFSVLHDEYVSIFERTLAQMPSEVAMSASILMVITAISIIVACLITGAIFGLIFGLIFAVLYDKIIGKTAIAKGLFIGLVYFIIVVGISFLMEPIFSEQAAGIEPSPLMKNISFALNFIFAIVFGYLLGQFWNRFEQPKD